MAPKYDGNSDNDNDDDFNPYEGLPSFRYSITNGRATGSSKRLTLQPFARHDDDSTHDRIRDRRGHVDMTDAGGSHGTGIRHGNDGCSDNDDCTLNSSLVVGGTTNVSSTMNTSRSNIHVKRGRHGKLPTKIRTTSERRVNTLRSSNRRLSAPIMAIREAPKATKGGEPPENPKSYGHKGRNAFNKYLKYKTQTAAVHAGKYKRRSDASSEMADVSILSEFYDVRRGLRRTISSHRIQRRQSSSERRRSRSPTTSRSRTDRRRRAYSPGVPRRRSASPSKYRERYDDFEYDNMDGRRVSFNNRVEYVQVPHPVDLLLREHQTKDPYRHLWFDEEDYDTIYNRSCDLIDDVIYGGKLPPSKDKDGLLKVAIHRIQRKPTSLLSNEDIPTLPKCVRGLEALIHSIDKDRERIKSKAWDAVLDEQHMQRKQHEKEQHEKDEDDIEEPFVLDDIEISNVYKMHSFKNQREAYRRGQSDAKIARDYADDTKQKVDEFKSKVEEQRRLSGFQQRRGSTNDGIMKSPVRKKRRKSAPAAYGRSLESSPPLDLLETMKTNSATDTKKADAIVGVRPSIKGEDLLDMFLPLMMMPKMHMTLMSNLELLTELAKVIREYKSTYRGARRRALKQ